MNLKKNKVINITEICDFERAIDKKKYPAGSCYIKLSAVDEFVGQIREEGEIDNRYCVFIPKDGINKDYLFIAISRSFPKFLCKYRTTINLQIDVVSKFELDWHEEKEAQSYIVKSMKQIQREIDLTEAQIEHEKNQKKYYLNNMFPEWRR